MIAIAVLWVGIVTWLLVRATTQFRHYETLRPRQTLSKVARSFVTIIVPARNEERNIAQCLRHLFAQDYPNLEILVVDDNSADDTAPIVSNLSRFDSRLRLIEGRTLPPGWAGKPHACAQAARLSNADWLCFVDADTVAKPALITTAVAVAEERGIDLLSLEPFQVLGGFWERTIIPVGLFLVAFQSDLRRVNNPDCPDAAANGQFILVRRQVYEAVGGHAAVRDEICEDTALARRVKSSGHRLALIGAPELVNVRMYTSLKSLWEGLSKNVVEMLGGTRSSVVAALAAFALGWVTLLLPLWAWHQFHPVAATLISLASIALAATHISTAIYFGIPFYYGLLFPVGYTMGGLIAFNSIWLRWKKRVSWKGRVYTPPPAVKPAQ